MEGLTLDLFLIIQSNSKNFEQRSIARRTWLQYNFPLSIKYKFVLLPINETDNFHNTKLLYEKSQYSDIMEFSNLKIGQGN